jgi:hypothetical protein
MLGVDPGTYMNKAQTMRTGQASVKRYMPHLLEHIRAGRIQPSRVFTHGVPLEEAPAACHTFARKQDGCIKVALFPGTLHQDPPMNSPPDVTTLAEVNTGSAYQALEPTVRPACWGVDLDPARRPGVPMAAHNPRPMAHARMPIAPMAGTSSAPMHGRLNKAMPPVFSTAVPLRGLSGRVRRFAAVFPDHKPHDWLLELFCDRVDVLEHRVRKVLPIVLPAVGAVFVLRKLR